MKNIKHTIVNYIKDYADPSIVLRVKKEVINKLSKEEECELLNRIILQKNVQTIIRS